MSATLAAVGWGLLGLLALAGVTISALVAYASTPAGRRAVASTVIRFANTKVAGRLELGAIDLQPGGAIAIREFKAYDPDGQLVLQVDRLVIGADLTRLRNQVVGIDVELDGAAILVNEDAQGRLSLVRAFQPAHPSPPTARERSKPSPWRDPLSGWTVRLGHLAVRGASLWWQDASGNTRVEAQDLGAEVRAILGPGRGRAEVSLRGQVLSPVPGALVFQLRTQLDGDALRVSVLRAQVGETRLDALAQADLGKRTGRAALTRATLVREEARGVVKNAPPGANLSLEAYAEADGRVATGAVHVAAEAGGGTGGGGDVAAAVRLDGSRAVGFDLALKALDPAAVVATLPAGRVTLSARGGLAGETLSSLRGNLDLALDPSRLRGGEVGPATAVLRVDRGSWSVSRLSLAAPGLHLDGAGSYQQGGAASAAFTAEIADLARALQNAGRLLGRRLPALSGRARVETRLTGTAAAPVIAARVASPSLGVAGASAAGIDAQVDASGPFRPGALRIQARVQRLASGGRMVARDLTLDGALVPIPAEPGAATATLSASGLVPSLGADPVSVQAAAALPRERRTLRLTQLAVAYPGTRYALEEPATLTFEGPRVDRLALVSGPRIIAVEGGIGPRRSLDARVQVVRLELARLPAGLLPAQDRIAGEVTADARVAGTLDRPNLDASLEVQGGGFRTEQGLKLKGTVRYRGASRRAVVQLAVAPGRGGTLDLDADLPLPFRGRSAEPVSAALRADGMPIPALLELAGTQMPLTGRLGADLRVSGTAGAPALHARVTVAEGSFRDLSGIALDATADLAADAAATAEVRLSGEPAVRLTARAPFSMAALLADPGRTVKGLRQARLTADATIPGLELATLSGRLGVPSGLRGRVTGELHAAGTPGALRGTAALSFAEFAYAGYTGIAARIESTVRDDRIEARVSAQLQGSDLLQLTATLRAPPERLATRAGLDAAGVLVDATVPGVDLERAAGPSGVAIGGMVDAKLHAEGTLSRPTVQLDASGRSIRVKGRPVGQVRVTMRAAGDRATADVTLDPPAGGKLTGSVAMTVPVSIDVRASDLRAAPTQVKVRAEAVDLGFVPALAPNVIRSAAGKLDADVSAAGPLVELVPRGTVRLAGGRVGFLEYGDWTGIALDVAVTEDAVELANLEVHRGEGSLQARAALRGLTTPRGRLEGRIEARKLDVVRAGMDLATVTMDVKLGGTYQDRRLDVRVDVPEGLIRLADKLPRELQSLEQRSDIVVGRKPPPKEAAPAGTEGGKPFTAAVHVIVPGRFLIQRVTPRINVELKADVTYEHQDRGDFMSGSVEVVRGFVEPIADRRFEVKRARVTFTGGPPRAAILDAEASWAATSTPVTVTVNVSGAVTKPLIKLTSQPPMDESQIAMLVATGQTDLKAGGGGAAGAAQNDVARSAAQQVGFTVFNTFIRDQLPFASGDVSLDASAAKVSGYIPGTKIYVGFTRRFDANRQLGENDTEVRMEYAITPHWALEGRWGNQNTGGASLIWSKDY